MRLLLFVLTALRAGAHPLEFFLERFLARGFGRFFLREALLFLVEPGAVVALPRNAAAAIEFENPLGRVVEEVAIVRDRDDGAGEALQELLEPLDALGIEMVRRLVEQQHVGLREQQTAQRDAAFLTARERADLRIPRRQRSASAAISSCRSRSSPSEANTIASSFACSAASASKSASASPYAAYTSSSRLRTASNSRVRFLDDFAHGLVRIELRLLFEVADRQSSASGSRRRRSRCRRRP